MIKSFSLAGSGNVATHVGKALTSAGYEGKVVHSGKYNNAVKLADELKCGVADSAESLAESEADLLIIALPDVKIPSFIKKISHTSSLVVHTSGTTSIDVLADTFDEYGVFYPLQTFSKNAALDFNEIPLCIEGSSTTTVSRLKEVANRLSSTVREIDSDQRAYLHLAAVFVNNFTNHLLAEAENLCQENEVDFKLLEPLARETVRKAFLYGGYESQTGPARRGDSVILDRHYEMLENNPVLQELYNKIAASILKKYHGNFE